MSIRPTASFNLAKDLYPSVFGFLTVDETATAASVCRVWSERAKDRNTPITDALNESATINEALQTERETVFAVRHPVILHETQHSILWKTKVNGRTLLYFRDKETFQDSEPIDITGSSNHSISRYSFDKTTEIFKFIPSPEEIVGPVRLVDTTTKEVTTIEPQPIFNSKDPTTLHQVCAVFGNKRNEEILIVTKSGLWTRWHPECKEFNGFSLAETLFPTGYEKASVLQVVANENFLFFRGTTDSQINFISYMNLKDPTQRALLPYQTNFPIVINDSLLAILTSSGAVALKVSEDKVFETPFRTLAHRDMLISKYRQPTLSPHNHHSWSSIQTAHKKFLISFQISDLMSSQYRLQTVVWDPWNDKVNWHNELINGWTPNAVPPQHGAYSRGDLTAWYPQFQTNQLHLFHNSSKSGFVKRINGIFLGVSLFSNNGKFQRMTIRYQKPNGQQALALYQRPVDFKPTPRRFPFVPLVSPPIQPAANPGLVQPVRVYTCLESIRVFLREFCQRIAAACRRVFCCRRT